MSTRSRIGLQLANGSVLSVYCHWDGYPEFNGVKLVNFPNNDIAGFQVPVNKVMPMYVLKAQQNVFHNKGTILVLEVPISILFH